jgi:hypothetical protein
MSLATKIKMLEVEYQNIEVKISAVKRDNELSESQKNEKLASLTSDRSRIIEQLRVLRRLDYDDRQTVNLDDH